jgi:hypothetical protein
VFCYSFCCNLQLHRVVLFSSHSHESKSKYLCTFLQYGITACKEWAIGIGPGIHGKVTQNSGSFPSTHLGLRLALLTPYWAAAGSSVPAGDSKGVDMGEVFILIDWDGLMGCTWRVHVRVLSIGLDMLPGSSWLWKRGSLCVSVHVDGQYSILVYFL